jgi:uncharacterized protein (DUF2237 family)
MAKNLLGTDLEICSTSPMTGFHRDGSCATGGVDVGVHVVCAQVTDDFLAFSRAVGNDLSTPRPEYSFPGLVAGDRWCVCAARWQEAYDAGHAPPVVLAGTHVNALDWCDRDALFALAIDAP